MRKFYLMLTPLVLTFSIGAGALFHVFVDPPGYCRAQQRNITDEEFIRASAALIDWELNRTYSDGTKAKDSGYYKNIDFDSNKRSGWKVNSTDFDGDNLQNFFRRLLGWQEVFVTWNTRHRVPPFTTGDDYDRFRYTVCGELLDSSMGPRVRGITTTNYLEITNSK